jgi:nitroimidazol reductase NimA-like FMN-containing flavoprotein (pyridoxamine 5'-phosphate oxidase superfamily)
MTENLRPAEFHVLDRRTCFVLLTSQQVGRLVRPGDMPFVAPVNYVVIDDSVVYRSDEGSSAARVHGEAVVFEVDAIDGQKHGGWSVVVRGTAEDITDAAYTDSDLRDRLDTWAPGPKDRWLRIAVREMTGRWLRGAEQPSPLDPRGYL